MNGYKEEAVQYYIASFSQCYAISHGVGIECVSDSKAAVPAEIVGEELLNVHHRGEVFAREPPLTLAAVGVPGTEVATIPSWRIRASAVIDK